MVMETANSRAAALLPDGLLAPDDRAALLAAPQAALIVAADGRRVLWASEAAARAFGFQNAQAAMRQGLGAGAPGTRRLETLGATLAGDLPARLERLRFLTGFRSVAVTVLLAPIRLGNGGLALQLALPEATRPAADAGPSGTPMTEAALATPPAPAIEMTAPEDVAVAPSAGMPAQAGAGLSQSSQPGLFDADAVPHRAAPTAGLALPAWLGRPRETRRPQRFVFALDAQGHVTQIAPGFAEIVGMGAAAITGAALAEHVAAFDASAGAAIRAAVGRGETFSGITCDWPVAGTAITVPVDLSALPVVAGEEGLQGFSGFGRCHLERVTHVESLADIESLADVESPTDAAAGAEQAAMPAPADLEDHSEQVIAAAPEGLEEESRAETLALMDAPADGEPAPETFDAHAEDGAPLEAQESADTDQDAAEAAELSQDLADEAHMSGGDTTTADPVPAGFAMPGADSAGEPPSRGDNVVTLRTGPNPVPPPHARSGLSMSERNAFREIARALGAKFDPDQPGEPPIAGAKPRETAGSGAVEPSAPPPSAPPAAAPGPGADARPGPFETAFPPLGAEAETALLDRLPIGILILKNERALFANKTLLALTGYPDLTTFHAEDGHRAIFRKGAMPRDVGEAFDTVVLTSRTGEMLPVDAHLQIVDWHGTPATLVSMRRAIELEQGKALRSVALDLKRERSEATELRAILDTATDGVVTLDAGGHVLSLNGAAEAVFGLSQNEVVGQGFTVLLHNESHAEALAYFEGLKSAGVKSVLNDGREVFGREKKGGRIPLFMTFGQISEGEPKRYCAVLHDLTAWKRAESELTEARRSAELASAKKSDFLTKISHEIRTPMNAIIGFAELMLEERLGPIGTPRYKEYLGDIRTSGKHVVSLVNDLLDLAKIEAGRMELAFAATDLNAIVSSAVAIIQPQANAGRVLVRTQLASKLPPVVADERSVRQIVLNMLSNATRFTEAGGQVIVATALIESGEAVIRIRDTGIGMTASEIEQSLEPFRQVGTRRDNSGTGLGLPLTKALVEANRANFAIRSTPGEGTLVEITFPSTRVLAE